MSALIVYPKLPPLSEVLSGDVYKRLQFLPLVPYRPTSPRWYLAWPTPTVGCGSPVNQTWTCWSELHYCSAPPTVRCDCGSTLHGHDPGDEQP